MAKADRKFWQRYTRLPVGAGLALLAVGLAQAAALHLLVRPASVPSPVAVLGRGLVLVGLPFVGAWLASRLAARCAAGLQTALLDALARTPTDTLEQTTPEGFVHAATLDVDHAYHAWRDAFLVAGFDAPVLIYLSGLLLARGQAGVLAGVVGGMSLLTAGLYALNRRVRIRQREHHEAYLSLQGQLRDFAENILLFRVNRLEALPLTALRRSLAEFGRLTVYLSQHHQAHTTGVTAAVLLLLWAGLWLLQRDRAVTPTDLAVLVLVFLEFRRIANDLFGALVNGQKARESVGRIRSWLALPPSEPAAGSPVTAAAVSVGNLTFRYADGPSIGYPPLAIQSGQRVWIQGANGRGKTTLWKMLTGLYRSSEPLRLDGTPRRSDGLTPLWANAAVVTEPARCYGGIVWELIGGFSAPRPTVADWLAAHGLLSSLDTFPDGLDTVYDSALRNLSAGQLKWLLLLQAFFRQPDLLILDEPFSALDAERRQVCRRLLDHLPPTTTLLVVSHESIGLSFDQTLVL
jgi:ABC-type bacteriocin/lantibiotic exporter with double-glycine peptidase domain